MRWQIVYLLRDFVVAPHTFVRPRPRDTAAPPAIGARVPELPGLRPGRPAVVAFLRHVGCPFAEATVRVPRSEYARAIHFFPSYARYQSAGCASVTPRLRSSRSFRSAHP